MVDEDALQARLTIRSTADHDAAKEASIIRRCCRVRLPEAFLAAGEAIRTALEGPGGRHLDHLREQFPEIRIGVYGEASASVPLCERLHVVALCKQTSAVEEVSEELLDLVETACGIVALGMGLGDEEIERICADIQIEQFDLGPGLGAVSTKSCPGGGAEVANAPASLIGAEPGILYDAESNSLCTEEMVPMALGVLGSPTDESSASANGEDGVPALAIVGSPTDSPTIASQTHGVDTGLQPPHARLESLPSAGGGSDACLLFDSGADGDSTVAISPGMDEAPALGIGGSPTESPTRTESHSLEIGGQPLDDTLGLPMGIRSDGDGSDVVNPELSTKECNAHSGDALTLSPALEEAGCSDTHSPDQTSPLVVGSVVVEGGDCGDAMEGMQSDLVAHACALAQAFAMDLDGPTEKSPVKEGPVEARQKEWQRHVESETKRNYEEYLRNDERQREQARRHAEEIARAAELRASEARRREDELQQQLHRAREQADAQQRQLEDLRRRDAKKRSPVLVRMPAPPSDPPKELLSVRTPDRWYGWESTWKVPAPPDNWASMLTRGPGGQAYNLRAFVGDQEVWRFPMVHPCVIFGSTLLAAHISDHTHEALRAQHAALVFGSFGSFALQPINGRTMLTPISRHPEVEMALARESRTLPPSLEGAMELVAGDARQVLSPVRCCFRLGRSKLIFFLDVLERGASAREAMPQTLPLARALQNPRARHRSPVGAGPRDTPADEESQENAWRTERLVSRRGASPSGRRRRGRSSRGSSDRGRRKGRDQRVKEKFSKKEEHRRQRSRSRRSRSYSAARSGRKRSVSRWRPSVRSRSR